MKDPIVDEVRKQRLEHTRKFKGDLIAICDDLKAIQKASGHKVVRMAPRKTVRTNDIMRGKTKRLSEGDEKL